MIIIIIVDYIIYQIVTRNSVQFHTDQQRLTSKLELLHCTPQLTHPSYNATLADHLCLMIHSDLGGNKAERGSIGSYVCVYIYINESQDNHNNKNNNNKQTLL